MSKQIFIRESGEDKKVVTILTFNWPGTLNLLQIIADCLIVQLSFVIRAGQKQLQKLRFRSLEKQISIEIAVTPDKPP